MELMMTPKRVEFLSDVTLVADACGDPAGPPVVFMHGGGQTRHAWRTILPKAARMGFYALSLDARGHGESGWALDGDYRGARFVDDIDSVVAKLDKPPFLIGASLGGLMSILYAGTRSRPIRGLGLIDCVPRLNESGINRIGNFMHAHPEGFASVEEAADAVARYRTNHTRPTNVSGLMKNLRLCDDGRYRWHWDPRFMDGKEGHASVEEFEDAASRITMPTLLLRGEISDVVTPEGVAAFRAQVPQTEYIEIAGADHMLTGDMNSPYDREVLAFLGRHAAD